MVVILYTFHVQRCTKLYKFEALNVKALINVVSCTLTTYILLIYRFKLHYLLYVSFFRAKIKSYSKTISTGNLLRHLRDDHDIRDETADKNKTITDFFSKRPRKSVSGSATATAGTSTSTAFQKTDKWLLARDLALWFCKSLLPFDSVSDEGMVDFFQVILLLYLK